MPRNTYGDTVKKRVKRLLEALLDFVNYEFEGNFDIEFKPETEDVTNPKVIFKTTLVALEQLIAKDKYPGKLKKEEIREALKLLENFLKILKDNRTKTQGSDDWHFTLTLWSKDREKNLKQFDKAWEDSRPEKSKAIEANFKKFDVFDWQNICLAMLEAEKPLTTNQLMRDEDDRFDLEEIHVPLALVERKKPAMRGENILPEQGSHLYEPEYEEKQRFEQEQFLLDILKDGKGKHKGKRIAIIGEPGAGKTTLLRKIAFWVKDNTEYFPISISLADLQEFTLEDYLLRVWLKTALKVRQVKPEMENALDELFKSERVWLLLDGVDEMPVQGEEPLWAISNQLKGWVGQARVVLTCRLNVWEANRNVLADNFEIYRTLEFSYGDTTTADRVEEFIAKWFNKKPNLGQQLRQALDEPGKERIKDLAKNPLRLALLCSTWNLWRVRGGLPDTKAKLYQGFVEKFYEWKGREFPTNYTQREQLNRALGELAKLAIDQTASRFRLKHSLVCEVLGKPDEGLFELALRLGWLNKVGLAAESPDEKVYAFWHPTFEEYFAALAVGDRNFFLPRNHVNRPVYGKPYRIFEPQWKEVILLWLGREDVKSDQKEDLINKLVEFNDGCGNFYRYRTYFLAASGIAEFKNCQLADSVVEPIVKWYFGYFNFKYNNRNQLVFLNPNPVYDRAKQAILETDRTTLLRVLINLLCYSQNEFLFRQAIECLGDFGSGNQEAIQILIDILCKSQNKSICQQAAKSLGRIGSGNLQAKNVLNYLIYTGKDEKTRLKAAESLQQLDPDHPEAIEFIIDTLLNKWDDFMPQEVIWILKKTTYTQSKAIMYLTNLLHTNQDEKTSRIVSWSLGQLDPRNSDAVKVLNRLLENNYDDYFKLKVAVSLEQTDPGNLDAIAYLIYLSKHAHDNKLQLKAIASLGAISHNNLYVINALIDLLDPNLHIPNLLLAIEMLGWSGYANSDAIAALTCLLYASNNPAIRYTAAVNLGEINPGNLDAINTLIELLHTSKDEEILLFTVDRLGRIANGNLEVITALDDLLHNSNNERVCWEAAWNLWMLDSCKVDIIYSLTTEQLFSNKMENNSRIAAWRLKEILQERLFFSIVKRLAVGLQISVNNNNYEHYNNYYENALYCAQTMPFPDFYQAWHQDTITNSATASPNLEKLPQFLAEAINDRPDLCSKVKLICLDSHQFIDPENPAPEIYDEMLNQNCPEWQNRYPDTMQKLKIYWNYLHRQSEIPLFFICYDSTALSATPTGFSDLFLNALSKFDRAICVVCEPGDIPLPTFSPSQPDLVAAVVAWIRRSILENRHPI